MRKACRASDAWREKMRVRSKAGGLIATGLWWWPFPSIRAVFSAIPGSFYMTYTPIGRKKENLSVYRNTKYVIQFFYMSLQFIFIKNILPPGFERILSKTVRGMNHRLGPGPDSIVAKKEGIKENRWILFICEKYLRLYSPSVHTIWYYT